MLCVPSLCAVALLIGDPRRCVVYRLPCCSCAVCRVCVRACVLAEMAQVRAQVERRCIPGCASETFATVSPPRDFFEVRTERLYVFLAVYSWARWFLLLLCSHADVRLAMASSK